ncbi:hypothetical protein HY003_00385 [Candidatus Saccharibacteria bacterium]|nr:hypothetical protein [Candidatus Saccharibacteria bacterium]MBI3337749.1 hypothetical protein [Candidatus Saccharibacteria bacterium]
MQNLLDRLAKDFTELSFVSGEAFCWSPEEKKIIYKSEYSSVAEWSLMHELAHGLLNHTIYKTDMELLMLEVAAWSKAEKLAANYDIIIDKNHIQDCIDTYRDWLDARSTCPECTSNGLQSDSRHYYCLNCGLVWRVTSSRFCRPYRLRA